MPSSAKSPARSPAKHVGKSPAKPAAAPKPPVTIGVPVPLDAAGRKSLKARAHALEPTVMISGNGLSEGVAAEIDRALARHELIKVRVLGDDRDARAALMDAVCARAGAQPVQHIGKILVVYKPRDPA